MTFDTSLKWKPSPDAELKSQMHHLLEEQKLADFHGLWRWSVEHKEDFWSKVWDSCGMIGDKGKTVYKPGTKMQDGRFFPDSKINFAENLLRRRDKEVAIVFKGEDKVERSITYKELYDQVSQLRQALKALGVTKGDRVAGYLPNMPETIMAMLAATSLGAIWSSASPDFGAQGVLDRFGQIEPKVLFAVDGYYYNGKEIDCREKVREAAGKLPSVKKVVTASYCHPERSEGSPGNKKQGDPSASPQDDRFVSFDAFKNAYQPEEIKFERFEFNLPLYIMFSSGTTGIPKCIVHGAGGVLLQHLKEHKLHCDIRKGDKVFYFTTCGWMMWNWLVSALASEATLMLFDGSPFYPDGYVLFKYAEKYKCTLFGTSAKYIDSLRTGNIVTKGKYKLDTIRMMTSTGSPLSPEGFDYVYDQILPNVHLASISGGTDIVSCFVLGNPLQPVRRGEIQGPGLGMDVDVIDSDGKPMKEGKGELVCKTPFPCMPVGFWNDPQGEKYSKAYFEKFPGIWCHGDWCEWTEHGGLIIHGRSDATLNPGGVRIGTAEIYRLVEQLPEIKESIAVGQDWDNDVRVVLFVILQPDAKLDEDLVKKIKKVIREGASPRHVPAKVIAVADIPRTKSNKITELAVREVIHGRPVKNSEALANPEALKLYENLEALKS